MTKNSKVKRQVPFGKLAEWILNNGMTRREFREKYKITPANWSNWLQKKQEPSDKSVLKLIKATNNFINSEDFICK